MSRQEWTPENPYFKTDSWGSWNEYPQFQIYIEGGEAYTKALIDWLEEPCTKHPYKDGFDIHLREHFTNSKHRYLCPQCMQELKDES